MPPSTGDVSAVWFRVVDCPWVSAGRAAQEIGMGAGAQSGCCGTCGNLEAHPEKQLHKWHLCD